MGHFSYGALSAHCFHAAALGAGCALDGDTMGSGLRVRAAAPQFE